MISSIKFQSSMYAGESLRARCPSISSIAIELHVPRDDFSSIAIELIFVTLRHDFEKAGSVLFDIGFAWDNDFLIRLLVLSR